MIFHWNEEKNSLVRSTRGISFERIVVAIEEGHLVDVLEHPNKESYPNQLVIVVDIDGYACCVPCVDEPDGNFFLKTLYMSWKFTKLYNLGGVANE